MAEKSAKRKQLEVSLALDPADPFLRYGLAVQCLRDGDVAEGRQRLLALIADHPNEVPAYQQLGQSYMETEEPAKAREFLQVGVRKAQLRGDAHAASEMEGLLALLG